MILRTLRLAGWRCFADPIEVGPFAEGVTVVHGPNATGKSTLFRALAHALLWNADSKAQDVVRVLPWGRDLAPTVTVEFAHGGREYRLEKRFLKSPSSVLWRREAGDWSRWLDEREADAWLREGIASTKQGEPGLTQILWAAQGRIAIGDAPDGAIQTVRAALDREVFESAGGAIARRIEKEYLDRFTEKRAQLKTGDRLNQLRDARDLQQARRDELQTTARRFAALNDQFGTLAAREKDATAAYDALAEKLKRARADAERYQGWLGECRRADGQLDAAQSNWKHLADTIAAIQKAEDERAEIERELAQHTQELTACETAVEAARNAATTTGRLRADLVVQERANLAAATLARDAAAYHLLRRDRDQLDDRLRQIEDDSAAIRQYEDELRALDAPDEATLAEIRRAAAERDALRLRWEASLTIVEIVPDADVEIQVETGENPGPRRLEAGRPHEIAGSPEVVVAWPGVGRIQARGVAESAKLARDRREAGERFARLVAPLGTDDVSDLERRRKEADEFDRAIKAFLAHIEEIGNGRDAKGLGDARAELAPQCAAHEAAHPEWVDAVPDPLELQRAAENAAADFRRQRADIEAADDCVRTALADAEKDWTRADARLNAARDALANVTRRLADATDDGRTAADRIQARDKAALEFAAARVSRAKLEEQGADWDGRDPLAERDELERRESQQRADVQRCRDERAAAAGELRALADAAPDSALAEVEEKLADLDARVAAETLAADALKLLRDTVVQAREAAVAAVRRPVEEAATQLLRRIAGDRPGAVDLTESFAPATLRPAGLDATVPPADLSGGESEQLHLAVRLALANVLARDERQMVVLDDVLAATDAARLARIREVLAECARSLQIVILTCHPERYASLPGAASIDLAARIGTGAQSPRG